jgi:hypothetical protein
LRVLSALAVSPSGQPQPLAIRGREAQQRRYRADEYELFLSISPPLAAEGRWQLEGQVLEQGLPLAGGPGDAVQLLSPAGELVALDVVDDFGYFALNDVVAGRYRLLVELPGTQILLEDLDVA